ncbi:Galactosylceramide Sulfotransferase [Manis pentadactyla]|nr:Galactosylceramide Sulfotransferase [Manis pentadactyla]
MTGNQASGPAPAAGLPGPAAPVASGRSPGPGPPASGINTSPHLLQEESACRSCFYAGSCQPRAVNQN